MGDHERVAVLEKQANALQKQMVETLHTAEQQVEKLAEKVTKLQVEIEGVRKRINEMKARR